MTTEQLAALKAICETAIRLKDGRMDEARSVALLRFHEAFKDPATCLALLGEVERLREQVKSRRSKNDPGWVY